MGFIDHRKATMDPVLHDDAGDAWCEGLGGVQDAEVELLKTAGLSHSPARCPDDALNFTGEGYALRRYEGETNISYRGRLQIAFPTRRKQGSPESLEDQLRAFGIVDVLVIREDDAPGFWPANWFSRFRVQLGPNFGTLNVGAFIIGTGVIGTTRIGVAIVDDTQQRAVKAVILQWKAARSYPADIILTHALGTGRVWMGRLIGQNMIIGQTPIGGYDRS